MRQQRFDGRISCSTGFNQQNNLARAFNALNKRTNVGKTNQTLVCRFVRGAMRHEFVGFLWATVIYGNGVAMVGDIQRQILTHNCEADEADVCCTHY